MTLRPKGRAKNGRSVNLKFTDYSWNIYIALSRTEKS
jgi:hypothetical protein